jgi:hypothetical protein
MNHVEELAARLLLRDKALELRASFERARVGSQRWAEIDHKQQTYGIALARANSPEEAQAIFDKAMAEIQTIVAADNADREAGRRKPNLATLARIDAQKRQARVAWADKTSAPLRASIRTLKDRCDRIAERLGAIGNEVEFREALELYSDALRSAKTTIDLEVRESIGREKKAA